MQKYKPNLINALQRSSKLEINLALKDYKTPTGQINFPAIFEIPSEYRITEIAKKDYKNTIAVLIAALTMAFESMNLIRPMNGSQIIDLADALIETSAEDNLALEDLLLFLQQLTRGAYGKMYEGMDMPKFILMLDMYREERFQSIHNIREEQAASHSHDRSDQRISEMNELDGSVQYAAAIANYEILKTKYQQ